uniref:Uncharacterized protein n=1 Tax=Panagrellus redivivus TaxID=6233 RepID=A0A7E4URS4_PANRE
MKSVQSSVMRPVDPNDPDEESNDTVFVETRGPRRPAIVREPNNWIKKQPITMSRKLLLGIQPEDVEARQPSKMHSHTGLPSKSNSASFRSYSSLVRANLLTVKAS